MANYLDGAGLTQVLTSVSQQITAAETAANEYTDTEIANAAIGVFHTNPAWTATDKATLDSWIAAGVATDPNNTREVKEFDVYTAGESEYYFIAGAWREFGPSLSGLSADSPIPEADINTILDGLGFPEITSTP